MEARFPLTELHRLHVVEHWDATVGLLPFTEDKSARDGLSVERDRDEARTLIAARQERGDLGRTRFVVGHDLGLKDATRGQRRRRSLAFSGVTGGDREEQTCDLKQAHQQ